MKRIIFLILMLTLAAQVRSQYATQEALEDTASAHRALIGLNLSRINTNRFNISENRSYINLNIHNISANTTNIASLTSIVSGFSNSLVNIVHTVDSTAHSPDNYATFSALADTASAHRSRIGDNESSIVGILSGIWDIENVYLPAKLNKADSTGHAKDRYATRSALLDSLDKISERNSTYTSSESGKPNVTIENTNSDSKGGELTFYKNGSSPSSGDTLAGIYGQSKMLLTDYRFNGIVFSAPQLTATQRSGRISFWNLLYNTKRDFLQLNGYVVQGQGNVWVNPSGANIDFRVDTEDSTEALFVDADKNSISTNVDSISFNSSAFIKSIGRTEYGDSLFIVVTPKHAEKDTVWLPLQ